ncbi:MAG: type II toxin-antitoxin system antitoxin SocA domain-containing protein [archaeon]|jgi:transcriptional regulator with XRE-family HTH domain
MIKQTFLLNLRKSNNISQAFIAEKIGVSRASYIEIEKGAKELTVSQANKIADILNISLEELVSGKITSNIKVSVKDVSEKKERQEIRIDVPQKNLKKFKEVLLYILEKVGSKSNVGMTVLYKLLYFIDFDYYEKFEEQLIGATYIKNHFGPTPVEFKKIVEMMESKGELETVKSKYFQHEQTKYLSHREPDISVLNAKEIKHIDEVISRLSDKTAAELSDYSHKDVPWITAEEGRPLSYESVFYRTGDTSVREYEPDEL